MNERSPWPAMLRRACALGLHPAAFWRLSVSEWRALNAGSNDSLSRQDLDALMHAYPDNTYE